MKRCVRPTVNLTPEEAKALEGHPDFDGSLGNLIRALALKQIGFEPPDTSETLRESLAQARKKRWPSNAEAH